MLSSPNLARRPFVNRRPVQRTALILAVAAALLLLLNLWLYVGYAQTRSRNATQLHSLEERIDGETERLAAADRALAAADLRLQNELVWFLNRRIDERSFGWSVLFDRLAGLLPNDVRLNNLAPRFSGDDKAGDLRNGNLASQAERPVELDVQGTARDGETILELIDALFADPAFRDPNLSQESQTNRGEVSFSMTVSYLPHAAERLAAEARAEQAGEETEDDEASGGADGEAGGDGAPEVTT